MRLKLYVLLFICLSGLQFSFAQGGIWTWVKGSNQLDPQPVYGTMGVPNAANNPQGVYEAMNWIDENGNFWIFGGVDSSGEVSVVTNDLWEYNPASNIWTWMGGPGGIEDEPGVYGTKGVPSPANWPGGRGWGSVSWTDNSGNLWLFGGQGYDVFGDEGVLNDLWEYNITTNEWTWISGSEVANPADEYGTFRQPSPNNAPGGRQENSSSWVDANGNLWLFGGMNGANEMTYSDMWQYNIGTNEWTWMKGPQGTGNPGSYGTFGVENVNNLPPPRGTYTRWKDAAGNFYIWGGIESFSPGDVYSDVWKYNTATNNWTWVGGESTVNGTGSYDLHCVDNGHTGPMARAENRTSQVLGCSNAFLTFGGFHIVNASYTPALNDLWLFNTQTYEWRWISGSDSYNDPGNYGTRGVASPANLPPARFGVCLWTDNSGNLWMFAGQDSSSTAVYNDVWKFVPDNTCLGTSIVGGIDYQLSPNNICVGDTALLTIDSTVGSVVLSPLNHATVIDAHHILLYPDSSFTYLITGNTTCRGNDSAQFTLTVNAPAHFSYTLSDSTLCTGGSATFNITGALNVQVSPSNNFVWLDSAQAVITPDSTATYTVIAQVACHGSDTLTFKISINSPSQFRVTADTNVICSYDTATICATPGFANYVWNTGGTASCITTQMAGNYMVTATDQNQCSATAGPISISVLVPGSFFSQVTQPDICAGDTSILLVSDTNIIYSPPGSITWIGPTRGILMPDTTTNYVLIAQVQCAVDTNVDIVTVSKPSTNITGNNAVCAGDSEVLCAPSGYLQYLWSNGLSTACFTTGAGTYSVTITDQNNCTAQSAPFTIGVHTPGQFNYALLDSIVCQGTPAVLSISGYESIQFFPSESAMLQDSAHALLTPDSSSIYTVVAGVYCRANDTVFVPVQVQPAPLVSITADSTMICSSDSVLICATSNLSAYLWSNGDSTSCFYAHLAGNYYVTATDENNCTAASAPLAISYVSPVPFAYQVDSSICYGNTALVTYSGSASVQIFPGSLVTQSDSGYSVLQPDSNTVFTIIALNSCLENDTSFFTVSVSHPQVSVSADTGVICANDSAQICATPGYVTYAWSNGESSACIYTNEAGNYYVTATDAHNCIALSNHIAIQVSPAPSISISIARDTFTVYDETVLQWYLNGAAIAGATGQVYIASQPGNYSVEVEGGDGCISVSNVFNYATDVNIIGPDAVSIYPNPLGSGSWQLDVSMGFIGQTMQIFDDNGRIVYSSEIHSLHSEITTVFASGIYFMRINSANTMIVRKIIKL